jgi:hypothetical protein
MISTAAPTAPALLSLLIHKAFWYSDIRQEKGAESKGCQAKDSCLGGLNNSTGIEVNIGGN